jgi:hypothetical protein
VRRVFICPELALPYLRVMLSLEIQGEVDMSKHHAIYMRVSTKRQDTASQEPELKRWAQSHEGDSSPPRLRSTSIESFQWASRALKESNPIMLDWVVAIRPGQLEFRRFTARCRPMV